MLRIKRCTWRFAYGLLAVRFKKMTCRIFSKTLWISCPYKQVAINSIRNNIYHMTSHANIKPTNKAFYNFTLSPPNTVFLGKMSFATTSNETSYVLNIFIPSTNKFFTPQKTCGSRRDFIRSLVFPMFTSNPLYQHK